MKKEILIPDSLILSRILMLRGKKVMIDKDLAELYGIETSRLNEQVKRNIKRFPKDFMFQINAKEKESILKSYPHLESIKYSRTLPYAFTEHGAVMLASVLNSDTAIQMNIQIVRVFTKMKEMLLTNKDILIKLERLEKDVKTNKQDIAMIFEALKHLLSAPITKRRMIGFNRQDEE